MVLGTLLLTAAFLKGHQLQLRIAPAGSDPLPSWLLPALLISAEAILGLWLVSRWKPRQAWIAALLAFSGFACYALMAVVQGSASCNCFGEIRVHPSIMLCIDAVAVAFLLLSRPDRQIARGNSSLAFVAAALPCILIGIAVAWTLSAGKAASFGPAGDMVVLKPDTWIGKRFPILDHIDIGEELSSGEWLVLLYHNECPECQAVLRYYESDECRAWNEGSNAVQIALIEVPPFESQPRRAAPWYHSGRLDASKQWFARTPLQIRLSAGHVRAILDKNLVPSEFLRIRSNRY